MNETGIPFSWFWAITAAAILGLLAADLIEKAFKALWARTGRRRKKNRDLRIVKSDSTWPQIPQANTHSKYSRRGHM